MNFSPAYLLISILLGAVGVFYMGWGKRRQQALMRACGLGLLIFPLLVNSTGWLLVIGLVLCAVPPVVARYY